MVSTYEQSAFPVPSLSKGFPDAKSIMSRGGLAALSAKDAALHSRAVTEYFGYWTDREANTEGSKLLRKEDYASLVRCYYDTVTDIIEHMWASSLHLFSLTEGETMREAARRHEHELARWAGIDEGSYVLDVGSGIGGPAREISRATGAKVLGINFNEYQIRRAIRYTDQERLSDRVGFVKADFMKMPLGSETFDCVYSIEGTSYAPDLEAVYSEIFRVLKPGGKFAAYELIMTKEFDQGNPDHSSVYHNIAKGLGLPNMQTTTAAVAALERCGFQVEVATDLAEVYRDIPWYYPFELSFKRMHSYQDTLRCAYIAMLTRSVLAGGVVFYLTMLGELFGILPPGTNQVIRNLAFLNLALVKGGQAKIFTPLFLIVARKPSQDVVC